MPGHNPLGEHVDDEGHVAEPGPAAAVGEVGHPNLIRGAGGEARFSRSSARLPCLAGMVVRIPLSRRTPASPMTLMARSTAPELTVGIVVRRR
jgi:hypothetical protein